MAFLHEAYDEILQRLAGSGATLVAVSKTKPEADIMEAYGAGQRDFGENYVQELVGKQASLPEDIRWHFIGHLQKNKVKYIAPFVHLVHGVDSISLLQEIQKQAVKHNRIIDCLLQVHIAGEETKFGFDDAELDTCIKTIQASPASFDHIRIKGLMGMASFSDDRLLLSKEFNHLHTLFQKYANLLVWNGQFTVLSMGMSSDYALAISCGSNMVRIGSLIFGEREKRTA